MLIDAEDIPDIASSLLKEHQAIFQCEVDAAMLMKCVRNMRVNVLYTKRERSFDRTCAYTGN